MSHATGKIEVAALLSDRIVFRYHRAADPDVGGKTLEFGRNSRAQWFDDYAEAERVIQGLRLGPSSEKNGRQTETTIFPIWRP